MILEKPFALFVFPAICLAVGLIFASFNVSTHKVPSSSYQLNELATIVETEGRVELSRFHSAYSSSLPESQSLEVSLFNLDKVQTRLASKLQVSFLDGYVLEFKPKSMFVIEQWNADENLGPIYINLISGGYKVLQSGRQGSLYIVDNGAIFDPNRKPQPQVRYVNLSINSQLSLVEKPETLQQNSPPQKPEVSPLKPNSHASLLHTLSNEYIDQTIARSRDQFVKCQQYAIRNDQPSKGQMLIGISINSLGKMADVKILASDIDNTELQKCVQSVLSRTSFRQFQGPEIVRSYPLVFE